MTKVVHKNKKSNGFKMLLFLRVIMNLDFKEKIILTEKKIFFIIFITFKPIKRLKINCDFIIVMQICLFQENGFLALKSMSELN